MRKSLIVTIAAALLVAAVICTAGCVDTKVADPIVGDWFAEDETTVSLITFAEDNRGYVITGLEKSSSSETDSGYSESSSSGAAASTFKWTAAEPRKTYTLAFADDTEKTASLDAVYGVVTIDDVVYKKMPSEMSGDSSENVRKLLEMYHEGDDIAAAWEAWVASLGSWNWGEHPEGPPMPSY